MHIFQQAHLSLAGTVTSNIRDPSPGHRNGSVTIGQRNHEQLMTKTNFGPIDDQTDFSDPFELRLQPSSCNRLVPTTHIHGSVRQKSAETSDRTFVLGVHLHFSGNLTEMHRVTMKDTNHQPHKVLYLRDALLRTQFTDSLNPSTIGLVDRHSNLPAKSFFAN